MGHNNSLYQELLHVPLIIKFPQSQAAGTRIEPCWQHIDIAPTILAYLGLPPARTMMGRAYHPDGDSGDNQRPAFISLKTGADAPRWHQGRYPWNLDFDAIRWGSWVLCRTWASNDPRHAPQELYDLTSDSRQRNDQSYRRPEITVQLNALLQQHLSQEQHHRSTRSGQAPADEVQRLMRSLQYLR